MTQQSADILMEQTRTGARAARTTLVGRINRRTILEHFLSNPRASLSELSGSLRMSNPTVRKAVGSLSETGLLVELPEKRQAETGRPSSVYRLAVERTRLAGVSLSATSVEVVESGLDGQLSDAKRREFATPGDYEQLLAQIAAAIRDITPGDAQLVGVGLSVPGEVDLAQQRAVYSPNLHVTDGRRLAHDLKGLLHWTHARVAMYKDTACGCLAERLWGSAAGRDNFVVLGVREGFGAGVWANGRLLVGQRNLTPEIGHLTIVPDGERCSCGNRGCLEAVATDHALAARVNRRLNTAWGTGEIIARMQAREVDAWPELDTSLDYLALGLAIIINTFAPELICLDSQMLDAAPGAFEDLRQRVEQRVFPGRRGLCEIRRSGRIDNSRGAVAAALHDFLNSVGPSSIADYRGEPQRKS